MSERHVCSTLKDVFPQICVPNVAVSCGYDTCFAFSACDGLCHLTKIMDRVETPFGFQPIVWAFIRHTVSRCLIFPALLEVNTRGFLQFLRGDIKISVILWCRPLPTGQYGLCFGYCFSGPLPPRSHIGQSTFRGLFPGVPSLNRLYSEIQQIHLSIEAQCDHHTDNT